MHLQEHGLFSLTRNVFLNGNTQNDYPNKYGYSTIACISIA